MREWRRRKERRGARLRICDDDRKGSGAADAAPSTNKNSAPARQTAGRKRRHSGTGRSICWTRGPGNPFRATCLFFNERLFLFCFSRTFLFLSLFRCSFDDGSKRKNFLIVVSDLMKGRCRSSAAFFFWACGRAVAAPFDGRPARFQWKNLRVQLQQATSVRVHRYTFRFCNFRRANTQKMIRGNTRRPPRPSWQVDRSVSSYFEISINCSKART